MNEFKVSTKNPHKLMDEIIDKIINNNIKSWGYNSNDNTIYPLGKQYIDHIFFKFEIDDAKGILIFVLHSDGHTFAESRAPQLLEGMLGRHFDGNIHII